MLVRETNLPSSWCEGNLRTWSLQKQWHNCLEGYGEGLGRKTASYVLLNGDIWAAGDQKLRNNKKKIICKT